MSLKRRALSALHHTRMLALVRHARRDGLVVVTYHGVLPGDDDRDEFLVGNFVAESAFAWQMAWIARRYRPVSMSEVIEAFQGGRPLPPRAIAVTFDDGFANNFRYAYPLLRRHGIPATVFLATGHIGVPGAQLWTERVKRSIYLTGVRCLPAVLPGQQEHVLGGPSSRAAATRTVLGLLKRMPPPDRARYVKDIERVCGPMPLGPADADRYDFLTWEEVRTMAADGIDFGSHTVSHPILSTLAAEDLEYELRESRQAIEAALQRECRSFAYPNGQPDDFGAREKAQLKACGYHVAFSQGGGVNGSSADPFEIRRVNISRGFDPALFAASLTGVLQVGRHIREMVRPHPTG
jgi:peptidoglycan/xylan/chitin deacetylase (PgdA/CDA1 family)